MGRGRGKGKKLTVNHNDDAESGEEEKIPAQKRRGRPQKLLKDEIDEEGSDKIELEGSEDAVTGSSNKEVKSSSENGKKRKQNALSKGKIDSMKEENGNGTWSAAGESSKYNGFRSDRNRRKNKPRRAAEAVVECI